MNSQNSPHQFVPVILFKKKIEGKKEMEHSIKRQ
jgi:hypothetical protein